MIIENDWLAFPEVFIAQTAPGMCLQGADTLAELCQL